MEESLEMARTAVKNNIDTIVATPHSLNGFFINRWDDVVSLTVQVIFVWGYEALAGRRGMGEGDSKLLMMIGAFLGWQPAMLVFFLAPLAGIVLGKREINNRKGHRMAFVQFSDATGVYEVTLFSEVLSRSRDLLEAAVLVVGRSHGPTSPVEMQKHTLDRLWREDPELQGTPGSGDGPVVPVW